MAHTTNKIALGTAFALAAVTMSSYVQGGEPFTLAEFGLTAPLVNVFFVTLAGASDQSQYLKYIAPGIIKLFSVATPEKEQPSGPVAFSFLVLVQGS